MTGRPAPDTGAESARLMCPRGVAIAVASELIARAGGWIAEMDINPLICGGPRITAADRPIVRAAE